MKNIKNIIDFSSWTGNWPFAYLSLNDLESLKSKLQSQNIVKAFVAPIEGILERDPMRANKKLLEDLKDDFFSPVPIIDLSFANWEEIVELSLKDGRVKILKLLPNYHMYQLSEEILSKLVNLTLKNKLLISIQFRVEDTRGQHPLMKIEELNALHTARILSYFPEQTFILNNLYLGEIAPLLHSLENVYVDISGLETQNVLRNLNKTFTLDKFLFSSHSCFYYPEGNIYKLNYSDLQNEEIEKVAYKNGEALLAKLV